MATGALAALGLLAGGTLLALPALEQRPEVAAGWIAEQLGREVSLREIELGWSDGAPLVRLKGLHVGAGAPGALALEAAEVRVDAIASLRDGTLRPEAVTVRGAQLHVDRAADGSLAFGGSGTDPVQANAVLGAVLSALPEGARFGLEDATVKLAGFGERAEPTILAPVSLQLRTETGFLRLSGALAVPASPDTPLRFTARWPASEPDPAVRAEITLSTRALPLGTLPRALAPLPVGGRLSVDLDGTLEGGRITLLRGTMLLEDPQAVAAPITLGIDAVHSLVEFTRFAGEDWRLSLLRLQTRTGSRQSPPSNVALHARADADGARHVLTVDHAPLAVVHELLPHMGLPPVLAARLPALILPQGRVEDVALDLGTDLAVARVHGAQMALRGVRAGGADAGVAIGPADMRITFIGDAGRMELLPAPVAVHDATFAASGSVRWHQADGTLIVDSEHVDLIDGDARLRVAGHLQVPADGRPPRLAVALDGAGLDATALRRYLGLGLLPKPLTKWLGEAIPTGRLREVSARVDGEVTNPADIGRALRLEALFEDATLRYAAGWPEMTALRGRIVVEQQRLVLDVESGTVAGARVVGGKGVIDDVSAARPLLTINGRVDGRTEQGSAFLAHTPIAQRFGGLLGQLDAHGPATLDLELRIPLDHTPSTVSGLLTLRDNTLRVAALRSALTKVSGELAFDSGGLGSGTLQALYLGRPISTRVDGTREERERTRLSIDGTSDSRSLIRHLHDVGAVDSDSVDGLPLLSRLSGEAAWEVRLDIPHEQRIAEEGIALTVTSDLAGMALDLPAPLGKAAAETRRLSVSTRLALAGHRVFSVSYGDDTRALLETAPRADGGHEFHRGALRFGDTPLELPDEAGANVAGLVPLLSVDDWIALIAEASAQAGSGYRPMARVTAVALRAQRVVAMGAGFDDVRVGAVPDAGGAWKVTVSGTGVEGAIRVPVPVGSAPVEASFERLDVNPTSATGPARRPAIAGMKPEDLPPARVVVRRLRYGKIDLGLAKLTLAHGARGLELRELFALSSDLEVRGSGRWGGSGAGVRSEIDLRLHSDDFGRLTKALGYGDSGIEGGAADVALSTQWNGSPFDFGLDRVSGELHFRAAGGRLREVEPGATGRVFGLFNLTVLPRRLLRLDFSDLFQEGMSYELIEGSFRLDGGNAWTENAVMHTDNARVNLVGRVGLVAEDYDQVMTVTPKLSASLPLAPLWLAEKFLNRKLIDNAFAYRYIITGPWSAPDIERERVEITPVERR